MDKYYCWASDFSDRTGEGNLARLFIKKSYPKNNYQIYTINNIKILNYKYFSPLIGIIFCWYLFIRGKKIVYLNYLPLWNCLLFIFLPPKTIFGPITGGAYYQKEFLTRKFLFPLAYKISEFFLNLRKIKVYFSTELLKKNLSYSTIRRSNFNYVLNYYKKQVPQHKEIDFLIYYRIHKNKESLFPYNLIKKLILLNFKIHIVGDFLNNTSVINHGYLNNKNVNKLLSKTFYSIASEENIYSLFTIECLNNNVKVIVNHKHKNQIKFLKKNFITLNFKNFYELNRLKYKNINFLNK
jgi:hypothetical protein